MSVGRYALGAAGLLIVVGSLAFAAVGVRRRYFQDWHGALAHLAEAAIGLGLLIATLEVLGAVGLFTFAAIVPACVVVGALGLAGGSPGRLARRPSAQIGAILAVVFSATVVAEWASPSLQSYDVGVHTFDSLWYHLPWAASFAQTAHVTPLRFTDVEYLTPFYPASAELLHGLGIVLLARDTLSPALNLMWLGLVLLAAWCIGRSRGAGPAAVLGAALAMATLMMNFSQAGNAANDVVGVFFLLAAAAFVLNGEDGAAPIVLAGVALGLAIGVKLSLVAPALALAVGIVATASRGRRAVTTAAVLGPLVLAGGFWYVRNLIAVGNPLPWASFGFLPTPDPPLQQHTGFSVAHYITDSGIWKDFFEPGLASGLGRWWWAIVALVVLGPLMCLLPGAGRRVRMLGLVALACVAAYLVTPETAAGPAGDPSGFAFNLRYAAPALALSLAIFPLAPAFAGGGRQAAVLVLLMAVFVPTVAYDRLWPTHHVAGGAGVAVAVLLLGMTLLWLRGAARYLVLGAGVVALVVAGYPWQQHYLRGRYTFKRGVSTLARTWAFFRSVHHVRVGVVGTFGGFFSYPLYGLDLSNRVQYVARRGPHGSFTPITSCRQWRAAVDAGRYRYLVATPARDPWHPKLLEPSPEAAWTASDRAAHVVLTQRAGRASLTLFRLSGPLDPAACPGALPRPAR